jgi:hypothetical protein
MDRILKRFLASFSGRYIVDTENIKAGNRPIAVYRLVEMPIHSCGQSVSAALRTGKRAPG